MGSKIIINPMTRISGFLEIEVEIEQKKIIDAKSSGMLFRGFEKMLKERSPFDAIFFTERICGICSTAHAMASTMALEEILNVTPNENSTIIRDYTQALTYSRLAHEMLAELGGKSPHTHGIFVGGVTVNLDAAKWIKIKSILAKIKEFVNDIMISDVYSIGRYYPDYFNNGSGYMNLLSYGVFNSYQEKDLFYIGPQVMIKGVRQALNVDNITENIHRAWYQSGKIEQRPTEPTIEDNPRKEDAYSWIKAPRYDGNPMEVGPLARMLLSGNYRGGISTMDRTIARVLEVRKILEIMEGLLEKMQLQSSNQAEYDFPKLVQGKGLIDTTRGALGHWIAIQDQKIHNYEIITPSSWNLSPEDSRGFKGVVEEALIGTYINDISNPVEIGRIVRSYDPCVSCATHVISDKYETMKIRIV